MSLAAWRVCSAAWSGFQPYDKGGLSPPGICVSCAPRRRARRPGLHALQPLLELPVRLLQLFKGFGLRVVVVRGLKPPSQHNRRAPAWRARPPALVPSSGPGVPCRHGAPERGLPRAWRASEAGPGAFLSSGATRPDRLAKSCSTPHMGGTAVASIPTELSILGCVGVVSRSCPPGSVSPDVGVLNPHAQVLSAKGRYLVQVGVVTVPRTPICCGGTRGPLLTYSPRRAPGGKTQRAVWTPPKTMALTGTANAPVSLSEALLRSGPSPLRPSLLSHSGARALNRSRP